MNVLVKGLWPQFLLVRIPPRIGERSSCVMLGKCNFRCIFCFMAGDRCSADGVMPDSRMISYSAIEEFVMSQLEKGSPIKITGGEPALFPETVLRLLELVRTHGGHAQLDTNGSLPDLCEMYAQHVDGIGLDIKGSEDDVEYLTGVPRAMCFDNPLRTLRRAHAFPCEVELKTVMFDFTGFEHLEFLYEHLPPAAYWELKQYRPHEGLDRRPKRAPLKPASKTWMLECMRRLCNNHPDLADRIVCIIGSGRNPKNYHYPEGSSGPRLEGSCQV